MGGETGVRAMAEISQQQIQQIITALSRAGAGTRTCPSCQHPQMAVRRVLYALHQAVQLHGSPAGTPRGEAGPTGRVALCAAVVCNKCGFLELHDLETLGLQDML
jgi:hypothetical protein